MNDEQYKKFDSVSVENIALDLQKRSKAIDDAMKKVLDSRIIRDKELFNSNYLQSCKSFIHLKKYYLTLCESIDLLACFLLKNVLPNYNEFSTFIADKFNFDFSSDVASLLDISINLPDDDDDDESENEDKSETESVIATVAEAVADNVAEVAAPVYSDNYSGGQVNGSNNQLQHLDVSIDTDDIEKIDGSILSNRAVIPNKSVEETVKTNKKLNLAAIGALGSVAGIGVLGGTKLVKLSMKEDETSNDDGSNTKVDTVALSKDELIDNIENGNLTTEKVVPVTSLQKTNDTSTSLPKLGSIKNNQIVNNNNV